MQTFRGSDDSAARMNVPQGRREPVTYIKAQRPAFSENACQSLILMNWSWDIVAKYILNYILEILYIHKVLLESAMCFVLAAFRDPRIMAYVR
jgi:hypothetical protein